MSVSFCEKVSSSYVCKINLIEMEVYFADLPNKFYPYLMHTEYRFIYEAT